jgi:hypothetical protein
VGSCNVQEVTKEVFSRKACMPGGQWVNGEAKVGNGLGLILRVVR